MVRVAPKKFNNETRLAAKMLNKMKRFEGKECPEEKYLKVMDMEAHVSHTYIYITRPQFYKNFPNCIRWTNERQKIVCQSKKTS